MKSRFRSIRNGLRCLLFFILGTSSFEVTHSQGTDNFFGVMFSYSETVSTSLVRLNDLGVKWCRVWLDVSDWNTPSNNSGNAIQQSIDLHNAGYSVIFHINSLNGVVPSYSQASAFYQWLIARPNLKASVDIWEIFNELNNTQYYAEAHSTTISMADQALHYINGALKAGWDVFHVANGEQVLGGSWTLWQQSADYSSSSSYTLALTQAYLDNGYLNYCDYAGIHPYHETAAGQMTFMSDFKNRVNGKPIIISEWGLKPAGYTATTYTTQMEANVSWMKNNILTACYYRFTPGNGWFGLVSSNYSATIEPCYTAYQNWHSIGVPVAVTGVSISPSNATVNISSSLQLSAVITPSNATNQSVSWSSSNAAVATVSSSGLITGVTTGNCIITVTTADGGYTANCNVSVVSGSTGNAISVNFVGLGSSLSSGESAGKVSAANWNNLSTSSLSNLVDKNGNVTTAQISTTLPSNYVSADGTTSADASMMRGYMANYSGTSNTVTVSGIPAEFTTGGYSVYIYGGNKDTDNDYVSYTIGSQTYYLRDNTSTWSGSHSRSMALTSTEAVTGPNYVQFENLNSSSFVVNIASFNTFRMGVCGIQIVSNGSVPVSSVSVSPTSGSINVGQTLQLSATISPANASNQNVSWTSGNTSVATVSSTGLVTAVAPGNTIITVTTADGNKTATCSVTVNPILVTSVSVTPVTATIVPGETVQLTATILPSNATNKSVNWSSSNTAVATVNSSGLVTGVSPGNAVVTVTTVDGNKTATCSVTVNPILVTSVSVTPVTATIVPGETVQLAATVLPSNATNKSVNWSSSNTAVATVNSSGLVTGVSPGNAVVTVTTVDGNKTATCSVTVNPVLVTSVSVSPASASIVPGGTVQLTATVLPSNATNKTVSWSSSNTSVATVSSSGLVTGIVPGNASITVTTQDGNKTAVSAITVNPIPVTGVSVSPASGTLDIGNTLQLSATVSPSNATNKTVSWSSSNSAVASVSSSGLITALASGTAVITVTTQDGQYTATCNITVNPPASGKIISVNFVGLGSSLSSTDVAGKVNVANWNNLVNSSLTNLIDQFGVNTGAQITTTIPSNYITTDGTTNADYKMMRGYKANYNNTANNVVVSSIPAEIYNNGYSVYVYVANKDADNDYASYNIGSTTYFLRDNTSSWNGTHSRSTATSSTSATSGPSYVRFDNLTGNSFTLTVQSFNTYRLGVCGLQIVPTSLLKSGEEIVSSIDEVIENEGNCILRQNYPNPFKGVTNIEFYLRQDGFVSLKVYNIAGHEVDCLMQGNKSSGIYTLTFNRPDLPSGTYILELITKNSVQRKKMILSK